MKVKVTVTGIDPDTLRALARWLGIEGEPAADIRAAVKEALEEEAAGLVHHIAEREGMGY